jgi:hypothetical protein
MVNLFILLNLEKRRLIILRIINKNKENDNFLQKYNFNINDT